MSGQTPTDTPQFHQSLDDLIAYYGGTDKLLPHDEPRSVIIEHLTTADYSLAINRASLNSWCAKFMKELLKTKNPALFKTATAIVEEARLAPHLQPAIVQTYEEVQKQLSEMHRTTPQLLRRMIKAVLQ